VIALAGKDAPVLEAFDVLARDSDVHSVEFHTGVALADFNGFANGVHRFFDVDTTAAQYAGTFDFADADDSSLPWCFCGRRGSRLWCSDVECYYNIMGLWE